MSQQPPGEVNCRLSLRAGKAVSGQQVDNDAVVVSGIECHAVLPSAVDQRTRNIQRLVAIEAGNLDREYLLDLEKPAPEGVPEQPASHRGLQVETKERDDFRHRTAMFDQFRFIGIAQRPKAQQPEVVTCIARQLRLAQRLPGLAANPCHADEPCSAFPFMGSHCLERQPEHRFIQTDSRITNCELRRVNPDRQAACPGVTVVSRQG